MRHQKPYHIELFDSNPAKVIKCGPDYTIIIDRRNRAWFAGNTDFFGKEIFSSYAPNTFSLIKLEAEVLDISCGPNFFLLNTNEALFGIGDNNNGQCFISNVL